MHMVSRNPLDCFYEEKWLEILGVLCECCKVFAEELPKRTQHAMQQKKDMRPILRLRYALEKNTSNVMRGCGE